MKLIPCLLLIGAFLLFSCSVPEDVQCTEDTDCVPDACCHASGAVSKDQAPQCDGMFCTANCEPGTLDCGQGEIKCSKNKCKVVLNE